MILSTTDVATDKASRYLAQLCKHWSHRFSVSFDPHRGTIDFGGGQSVELAASDAALAVTVRSDDEDKLARLEQVVADHLTRFAFRETLAFAWARSTRDAGQAQADRRHVPAGTPG